MQLLVLFSIVLTASLARSINGDESLPNNLQNVHFQYEGVLKTRERELPVTGEFWFHTDGVHEEMLDRMELEDEGRTWRVQHLSLLNKNKRTQRDFTLINDKCIQSEYTEDKGTFPTISQWRQIGNNKFERVISNRISLNRVLKFRSPRLGAIGSKTHDVKVKLHITLQKSKISHVDFTIYVDGKAFASKITTVTTHLPSRFSETIFKVPSVCKTIVPQEQRRAISLTMFLLGVDLEGKRSSNFGRDDVQRGFGMSEGMEGQDENLSDRSSGRFSGRLGDDDMRSGRDDLSARMRNRRDEEITTAGETEPKETQDKELDQEENRAGKCSHETNAKSKVLSRGKQKLDTESKNKLQETAGEAEMNKDQRMDKKQKSDSESEDLSRDKKDSESKDLSRDKKDTEGKDLSQGKQQKLDTDSKDLSRDKKQASGTESKDLSRDKKDTESKDLSRDKKQKSDIESKDKLEKTAGEAETNKAQRMDKTKVRSQKKTKPSQKSTAGEMEKMNKKQGANKGQDTAGSSESEPIDESKNKMDQQRSGESEHVNKKDDKSEILTKDKDEKKSKPIEEKANMNKGQSNSNMKEEKNDLESTKIQDDTNKPSSSQQDNSQVKSKDVTQH